MSMLISKKRLIEKLRNIFTLSTTTSEQYNAIADEIFRLRGQKEKSEVDSYHREEAMNRIKELQDFIDSQQSEITEFDESLVRKLIQQISVYDDRLAVRFKSGLEVNINE